MWPKITAMLKHEMEQTGRFTVDVQRTKYTWKGDSYLKEFGLDDGLERQALDQPKADPDFAPKFSDYDVVISNFGWNAAAWPDSTRADFEAYVAGGGGFALLHAADNSFGDWDAYNRMIGLGGWGDRNEKTGPYVYFNASGQVVRDMTPGAGGHHGPQREFPVIIREPDHPITQGLPNSWMHAKDELYDKLRGPAQNMTILASAYADADKGGSGRDEPVLMVIDYGKGRVFHSPLGHADYSVACVGFITTFLRGCEWAATGNVTLPVPKDFPTLEQTRSREFK
jgi:type 1 glutamine amidotransferase